MRVGAVESEGLLTMDSPEDSFPVSLQAELEREITERKRAEEALLKQTEILQSILNNMGDAVIVADEK
jgi:PAS domain-containing protein